MTSPSAPKQTPTAAAAPAVAAAPVSTPPPPPPPVRDSGQGGPGRSIRAAREKLGLTLESLAAQTRLARGTLEALERDDFGTLNEPVYVKGYYRKCAKVLGLSDGELIAAYERQVGPKQPQAPTKLLLAGDRGLAKGGRATSIGGGGFRWLWIVIVAAVIGGGAYLLSANPGSLGLSKPAVSESTTTTNDLATVPATPVHSAAAPPATQPVPVEPSSATPATATEPSTPPPAHTASSPVVAATPSTPAATLSTSAAAASPSASLAPSAAPAGVAGGEGSLALSFKGTSWVRIEDASGKILLSGVIQAGDHQAVRGKPPYSVFLGNAPGVTVDFSGKPYDVTPFIKQNSTARFSVPQ